MNKQREVIYDERRKVLFGEDIKEYIMGMMNDKVKSVDIYDALMKHRTEYIYFRTDHHWTVPAGFWAAKPAPEPDRFFPVSFSAGTGGA